MQNAKRPSLRQLVRQFGPYEKIKVWGKVWNIITSSFYGFELKLISSTWSIQNVICHFALTALVTNYSASNMVIFAAKFVNYCHFWYARHFSLVFETNCIFDISEFSYLVSKIVNLWFATWPRFKELFPIPTLSDPKRDLLYRVCSFCWFRAKLLPMRSQRRSTVFYPQTRFLDLSTF